MVSDIKPWNSIKDTWSLPPVTGGGTQDSLGEQPDKQENTELGTAANPWAKLDPDTEPAGASPPGSPPEGPENPGQTQTFQAPESPPAARRLEEILTETNLVYQSGDVQVYAIPGDIDISQFPDLAGQGMTEFIQRKRWSVSQELETMKRDALVEKMAVRLQNLEEALQSIQKTDKRLLLVEEQLKLLDKSVKRLNGAEERLAELDQVKSQLRVLEEKVKQLEEFCNSPALSTAIARLLAPDFARGYCPGGVPRT